MQQSNDTPCNQNCSVILLGATGSGKSTLGNVLCGRAITVEKNPDDRHKPLVSCNHNDAFQVGHDRNSKTNKCSSQLSHGSRRLTIIDTPGFFDTHSKEQRCENAINLFESLMMTKDIQVILVLTQDSIYDSKGTSIVILIEQIQSLFKNLETIIDSTMIVVTGVEDDYTLEDISIKLLVKRENLEESITNFFQHLCSKKRICLFCRPKQDQINKSLEMSQFRNEIFDKLGELQKKIIQDINVPLDDATINMIRKVQTFDSSKKDDTLVIKGILISLSNIVGIIEKEKPKIVKIFASKWILCDINITAPGILLVMISPIILLSQDITINLKGLNGQDHPQQSPLFTSEPGKDGENGLCGNPGQNGGNFVLAVDQINGVGKIIVDVSGGDGGLGQQGQDGTNGQDGRSGSIEDVSNPNEEFLIHRERFSFAEKDALGIVEELAKSMLTFNQQFKDTYRSKYVASIDGGKGGAGGKGGKGGLSGKIIIRKLDGSDAHQDKLQQTQLNGHNGIDGRTGTPGKAGVSQGDLFTYERIYINERILPVIRGNIIKNVDVDAETGTQSTEKIVSESTEKIVSESTEKIASESTEKIVSESTEKIVSGPIIERVYSAWSTVQSISQGALAGACAVGNATKGFWATGAGIGASCGVSLLVQSSLSIGSSILNSKWETEPYKINVRNSLDGEIAQITQEPIDPSVQIQLNFDEEFNHYKNNL